MEYIFLTISISQSPPYFEDFSHYLKIYPYFDILIIGIPNPIFTSLIITKKSSYLRYE